jgi:hypothetical protein
MASYDDPQDLLYPSTASEDDVDADDVEASADYEPPPHSTTQSPLIAPSYLATMQTTTVAPPPPTPLALTYDPMRSDRASRYRNPVQHTCTAPHAATSRARATSPAAACSTAVPAASPQADMPKAPASYKEVMLSRTPTNGVPLSTSTSPGMLGYIRSRRLSCPPTVAPSTSTSGTTISVRPVEHDQVRITKVPTGLNRADLFTKPVTAELFHCHVSALMRP